MPLNIKRVKNAADRAMEEQEKQDHQPDNLTTSITGSLAPIPEKEAVPAKKASREPTPTKKNPKGSNTNNAPEKKATDKPDRGFGLNKDGTYRQSNGGRKEIAAEKRRKNFSLCLGPDTIKRIEDHITTSGKTRKATHYVSQYIEDHLEEILDKL